MKRIQLRGRRVTDNVASVSPSTLGHKHEITLFCAGADFDRMMWHPDLPLGLGCFVAALSDSIKSLQLLPPTGCQSFSVSKLPSQTTHFGSGPIPAGLLCLFVHPASCGGPLPGTSVTPFTCPRRASAPPGAGPAITWPCRRPGPVDLARGLESNSEVVFHTLSRLQRIDMVQGLPLIPLWDT